MLKPLSHQELPVIRGLQKTHKRYPCSAQHFSIDGDLINFTLRPSLEEKSEKERSEAAQTDRLLIYRPIFAKAKWITATVNNPSQILVFSSWASTLSDGGSPLSLCSWTSRVQPTHLPLLHILC